MSMKVSKEGLALIQKFEGFYEDAYLCQGKVWTVGYGTTKWADGRAVKKGDKITKKDALELLEKQVNEHASSIASYVRIKLTQPQFDALASFQYNLGKHILNNDKALTKYINAKDWENTTRVMQLYVKADGKTLPGLINRRKAEVELFMQQDKEIELTFSSATLAAIVKSIMNDKEKQIEIVNKAANLGIIDRGWINKFKSGQIGEHDIIGICMKYALSK